jgi:hypothetical protein
MRSMRRASRAVGPRRNQRRTRGPLTEARRNAARRSKALAKARAGCDAPLMKLLEFVGLSVVVASFVGLSGCSDDTSNPGGGGTSGSAGSSAGTGGSSAGTGGSSAGTGGSAGAGTGAWTGTTDNCTSAADQAAIDPANTFTVGSEEKTLTDIGKTCGTENLTSPDKLTAVAACIKEDTGGEISDKCVDCAAFQVVCSIEAGCVAACIADANAEKCIRCRCAKPKVDGTATENTAGVDCIAEYNECSGVPSTTTCDGLN